MKFFSAFILSLFFAFSALAQKQAEVIVFSTHLRNAPDAASEKVKTLMKGEKIIFEKSGETDGWFYVSVENRTIKGWIRKDTIQRIADVQKAEKVEKSAKSERVKQLEKPEKSEKVKVEAATKSAQSTAKNKETAKENAPPKTTAEIIPAPDVSAKTPENAAPNPNELVEDKEEIRIETEEVSLKVRVIDEKNRAVRNLNHTQFQVYEDDVVQPIASLTTTEVPVINALLIDNSRSLRTQLGKIIEAGKIIVNSNLAQDETTVVRFVGKDKIETVQNFTSNKSLLDNALENLSVEGGQTAIFDAIFQTAKRIENHRKTDAKETDKIRALIIVSDGDDRSSTLKEQELFDFLRASQVQIYTVGFTNDLSTAPDANGINRRQKAKSFMTRLAEETGGKAFFPASIADLPQIAAEISAEIRTQYLVSYTPTNDRRDGTFRRIKVVVEADPNGAKRIASTRSGRTAAPK